MKCWCLWRFYGSLSLVGEEKTMALDRLVTLANPRVMVGWYLVLTFRNPCKKRQSKCCCHFYNYRNLGPQEASWKSKERESKPFLLILKYIQSFLLRAVNEIFSKHYSLAHKQKQSLIRPNLCIKLVFLRIFILEKL